MAPLALFSVSEDTAAEVTFVVTLLAADAVACVMDVRRRADGTAPSSSDTM